MRKLIKIFSLFLFFISLISSAFALTLDSTPTLVDTTENSITFSFDPVEGASYYMVYYDTESREGGLKEDYLNQPEDPYDTNEITVNGLEKGTTYYFSVTIYDENFDEGELSKEFSFSTKGDSNNTQALKIESIGVVNTRQIKINFNLDLDELSNKEIRIVNSQNDLEELNVVDAVVQDKKNLLLTLASDLKLTGEYNLTIISLKGTKGETIDAGVDGTIVFSVPEDTIPYSEPNNTVVLDTTTVDTNIQDTQSSSGNLEEEINMDLNAAPSISGENLSNEQVVKTAESVSENPEKLPQTGPVSWLLLVLALAITGVYIRFKKA